MNSPEADPSTEVLLVGGRITPGVVRVGETVRRPVSQASGKVRLLLEHLEAVAFDGAPRYLGVDDKGRDVLEFLPGYVPADLVPLKDAQVVAGARLLRRFHDATRDSSLVVDGQVVCHRDAGPNNCVFRNDLPVAFIDFDMTEPGDPLDDLAYMCWLWCISSEVGAPPPQRQAQQVARMVRAYGADQRCRTHLVPAVLAAQNNNAAFWRARAISGVTPARLAQKRIDWSCREQAFTDRHAAVFASALGPVSEVIGAT